MTLKEEIIDILQSQEFGKLDTETADQIIQSLLNRLPKEEIILENQYQSEDLATGALFYGKKPQNEKITLDFANGRNSVLKELTEIITR